MARSGRFDFPVIGYLPCEEWNRERRLGPGKYAGRWVAVFMACGHGKVQQENGKRRTRECRICRMLAEAPGRERRAA
jgi:hypothetical protein